MRNLTLIKCTPGYPMSIGMAFDGGTTVFGTEPGHRSVSANANAVAVRVERKRVVSNLTAAHAQTIDLPSIVSAPPHERRARP